jgi:hypothetical protein
MLIAVNREPRRKLSAPALAPVFKIFFAMPVGSRRMRKARQTSFQADQTDHRMKTLSDESIQADTVQHRDQIPAHRPAEASGRFDVVKESFALKALRHALLRGTKGFFHLRPARRQAHQNDFGLRFT